MKNIFFNSKVAEIVGVNSAIVFQNLCFWIYHNQTNNKNFFNGKYWTFNSVKAFAKQLTFLSEKQIRKAIDDLIKAGFIVKDNFNDTAYDRTTWYALGENEEAIKIYEENFLSNADVQNVKMDLPCGENGIAQKGEPIPYIKQNKNKNTSSLSADKVPYQDLLDLYHECLPMLARIRVYNDRRKKLVAKIWTMADDYKHFESKEQGLAFFRKYFESCARSNILTGNSSLNWQADFEFIFTEKCFLDKLENGKKYR